jgi:rSAM/selenodomain-associated transferase 2
MGVAMEGPDRSPVHRQVPVTQAPVRLSIVIPALDEQSGIARVVADAARHADEVIVVDGASTDATARIAADAGAVVIAAERGRASQMNAGASAAGGEVLLFLHADCSLPAGAGDTVRAAVRAGARWGRFDVTLDSRRPLLACVATMINLRSRATGICTGDQAIFVTRDAWDEAGGYPSIPLMEDVALSTRLYRRHGRRRSALLRDRVLASARRWERHGAWRTIVTMWWLRALYRVGVSPRTLHRMYYGSDP